VSELDVNEGKVRSEHLKEVNAGAQWLYLFGVVLGAFLLMIALMAMLGATTG
jgi:hypothetical protein